MEGKQYSKMPPVRLWKITLKTKCVDGIGLESPMEIVLPALHVFRNGPLAVQWYADDILRRNIVP